MRRTVNIITFLASTAAFASFAFAYADSVVPEYAKSGQTCYQCKKLSVCAGGEVSCPGISYEVEEKENEGYVYEPIVSNGQWCGEENGKSCGYEVACYQASRPRCATGQE